MTTSDLANRALSHVDSQGVQIDPISLTILLAILSAVISHYVERCLNRVDHRTVASPNFIQRGVLWVDCLSASRKHGGTREAAKQAYDALLKMGAGLSESDLASIKAGAAA